MTRKITSLALVIIIIFSLIIPQTFAIRSNIEESDIEEKSLISIDNIIKGIDWLCEENISKGSIILFLYKFAQATGNNTNVPDEYSVDNIKIDDNYLNDAIRWATYKGIIEDIKGNSDLSQKVTRSEFVLLSYRFCTKIDKKFQYKCDSGKILNRYGYDESKELSNSILSKINPYGKQKSTKWESWNEEVRDAWSWAIQIHFIEGNKSSLDAVKLINMTDVASTFLNYQNIIETNATKEYGVELTSKEYWLIKYAETYLGRPYNRAGSWEYGVVCDQFMKNIYTETGYSEKFKYGGVSSIFFNEEQINIVLTKDDVDLDGYVNFTDYCIRNDIFKPGDILFFGTSISNLHHIGVIAGIDKDGNPYMIHSSNSRTGIIEHALNGDWWNGQLNERDYSSSNNDWSYYAKRLYAVGRIWN